MTQHGHSLVWLVLPCLPRRLLHVAEDEGILDVALLVLDCDGQQDIGGQFSRLLRSAAFQIEGLNSQSHCASSLRDAPWKFKSPKGGPIFPDLIFEKWPYWRVGITRRKQTDYDNETDNSVNEQQQLTNVSF